MADVQALSGRIGKLYQRVIFRLGVVVGRGKGVVLHPTFFCHLASTLAKIVLQDLFLHSSPIFAGVLTHFGVTYFYKKAARKCGCNNQLIPGQQVADVHLRTSLHSLSRL